MVSGRLSLSSLGCGVLKMLRPLHQVVWGAYQHLFPSNGLRSKVVQVHWTAARTVQLRCHAVRLWTLH